MEKENILDAVVIRVILTSLILTAVGLKAIAKLESVFFHVKIVEKSEWEHERHLAASNRQTYL